MIDEKNQITKKIYIKLKTKKRKRKINFLWLNLKQSNLMKM